MKLTVDMESCRIEELPEKEILDPKDKIVIKVTDLYFNDIPTLISTVRFELQLNDKPSSHSRLAITTRKGCQQTASYTNTTYLKKGWNIAVRNSTE